MSLAAFHIVFIVIATLHSFFVTYWCVDNYLAGEQVYLWLAIASFVSGVLLIFYGFKVFKKLKNLGVKLLALSALALCTPDLVQACSTCYADPDSPTAKALTVAVAFLLGIVIFVLGGFLTFMVNYNLRNRRTQREG